MVARTREHWQAIVARKQACRAAAIPKAWYIDQEKFSHLQNVLDVPATCGLLSLKELEITGTYDAVDLLEKIRNYAFSVEEVVTAFCKRAAIAQQLTNCLTEIMFEEAIHRARLLDERRKCPDFVTPKLFGLPVSLKDSFKVANTDATIGMVCFAEKPSDSNSALVDLLLAQGAVVYCKTNVPQTLMTADSDNNIFGRTMNPANRSLTAGGSTGGEGALIALRGSVAGFGTDIAGSIRIPSHCNGIYGMRPSVGLVPLGNKRYPGRGGMAGISPVAGPMATSVRSCSVLLQTVMESEPWKLDPTCTHLYWRGLQLPSRPLRIGIAKDNGHLTPTPPIRRALREAREKLLQTDIEIVDIELKGVSDDMNLVWKSFSMDGSKAVVAQIEESGEPHVHSVAQSGLAARPGMMLEDLFDFNEAREKVQARYASMWLAAGLDALILPPAPFPAAKIDVWADTISYTAMWNLLDYPAMIIPTGRVSDADQPDSGARYGNYDEQIYRQYTGPTDFADAPITLQVVGMHQEDEWLALVGQKLDHILNGSIVEGLVPR